MMMSLVAAPLGMAMTATEMLPAITTGATHAVVGAVTVLVVVMETTGILVAAATTGLIIPDIIVAVAMVLEVVVVTGVAVTMREGVISPLGTSPEFQ